MIEAERSSPTSGTGAETVIVYNPKPELTEQQVREGWTVEPVGPRGWGKFLRTERLRRALTGK